MDSTASASAVARELGTSTPRVIRAAKRLGLDKRSGRGHLRFSGDQQARLRAELGQNASVSDLTPVEAQAFAALVRSPLGLPSARALARKAGLSPTAASRAINQLRKKGLVRAEPVDIIAGRPRRVNMLYANWRHPGYARLAEQLKRVEAPACSRDARVPARLTHLFWNTSPSQLDVKVGGPYIARRLLRTLDPAGLSWGARNLRPDDWLTAAQARGLSTAAKALAENLAAESER